MLAVSHWLFDPAGLTPYGFCLLWQPGLIWTYALADLVIAISYLTIPLALAILTRRRRDLMFRPAFMLFAAFITLCGGTHLLEVLTLWIPAYGIQAVMKSTTAVVSLGTAIAVWWFLPAALRLPSKMQMDARKQALARLAAERQRLLDMVNLAAVMLREMDGTVRFWSEGCQRLYGWTAEQAVGRSAHDLLQTVFPTSLDAMNAALLDGGSWNGELLHRARDGATLSVLASMSLNRYDDASVPLVLETATDATSLRRTETDLLSAEAQMRSLVETAADGFAVAQADGRIVTVNPAGLRMFGYDRPDELVGRNLGVLMTGTDSTRHDGYIAAHRAGAAPRVIGKPSRDLLAVRRDGSEFPIDLSVSSFGVKGQHHLIGVIRDATERKKAERAVLESEARFRLLADNMSQFAWIADETGWVTWYNRRWYDYTGTTFEAMQGWGWQNVHHPDHVAGVLRRIRHCFETGEPWEDTFPLRSKNGQYRSFLSRALPERDADGCIVRWFGTHTDVTEQRAAEDALTDGYSRMEDLVNTRTAALAQAEARFRGIFNSQSQFMSLLAPDGTVLEMNRSALDASTLMNSPTLGRPFWDNIRWPAAERDRLRQDLAAAARGALINREIEITGTTGKSVWVTFSLTPVRDLETGLVTSVISESRDLTETRDLAGQLAQAQKMQALGQLSGGIAHDFNNILQAVSGAARLIERQPGNQEKTRHLAGMMIAATSRGASITQRLLSFARRGELHADVIDTTELLKSVREVLAHTIGTTITVETTLPPDLPALFADQAQLETAIINLGTNARDAMPEGGTLTLSAAAEHVADGSRHAAGLVPGAYVRLSVTDTGTGMDAATLARVSEPFFTTKPPGRGTGLGVAMVKGFAEQSGGGLWIDSVQGRGTTATMWLRQAASSAVRRRTDEHDARVVAGSTARILVVDDDDLVRHMVAAQLEDEGFATLVATSGTEAISLLASGEVVDALVSDLSMPGMNGLVTIRKARAMRPRLPCFLLTGYAGERAALSGEDTFTLVRKPVSGRSLVAQIEASLEVARS